MQICLICLDSFRGFEVFELSHESHVCCGIFSHSNPERFPLTCIILSTLTLTFYIHSAPKYQYCQWLVPALARFLLLLVIRGQCSTTNLALWRAKARVLRVVTFFQPYTIFKGRSIDTSIIYWIWIILFFKNLIYLGVGWEIATIVSANQCHNVIIILRLTFVKADFCQNSNGGGKCPEVPLWKPPFSMGAWWGWTAVEALRNISYCFV